MNQYPISNIRFLFLSASICVLWIPPAGGTLRSLTPPHCASCLRPSLPRRGRNCQARGSAAWRRECGVLEEGKSKARIILVSVVSTSSCDGYRRRPQSVRIRPLSYVAAASPETEKRRNLFHRCTKMMEVEAEKRKRVSEAGGRKPETGGLRPPKLRPLSHNLYDRLAVRRKR